MPQKRYDDDKLFRFHWGFDKQPEESYGRDVADAFGRLGYGDGAIRALDHWEQVETNESVSPNEP